MTNTKAAVPAQIDDLRRLIARLTEFDADQASRLRAGLNKAWLDRELSVDQAATWIKAVLTTVRSFEKKATTITDGRYAVETDDGHLAFYEVWTTKNGYQGVSLQVSDSFYPMNKAVAKTILDKILKIGPLEAMKAYGKEIGECGKCHRTLTNEASRAIGIGPVCLVKYF